MSLQFLHINFAESKPPQVRTAGVWNIAVAIEHLGDELRILREEATKVPSILAQHLGTSSSYRFTLRSGETISGRVDTFSSRWILVERPDRKRTFIAVDAIEAINEE
jgi:hypothetical protein